MNNNYGFVRIGCVSPELKLADIPENTTIIAEAAAEAASSGCDIIIFPELSLTGYSCADLFHQQFLQKPP